MTQDLGQRRRDRGLPLRITLAVVAILGVIGVASALWVTRQSRVAEAKAWTVSGPACAQTSPQALIAADQAPVQVAMVSGVRFARAHGAVRCAEVGANAGRSGTDVPVCQFDHPGGLEVTTSFGQWDWSIGGVRAATVRVEGGRPTCVIGSSVQIH